MTMAAENGAGSGGTAGGDGAQPRLVAAPVLREFAAGLFAAAGLRAEDADRVARCLVGADLRGTMTHGVSRCPIYLDRLARGVVNPRPRIAVENLAPALARVDGDNGMGFLAAGRAMEEAIRRARLCGIGLVVVRRSNHFGVAASYLQQALDEGMAAFVFTNASPTMPVWGGRVPFLGTSPFGFAAPGAEGAPPLLLDMATSVVARGRIRRAAAEGRPIPEGWALDAAGRPTTDAQAAYEGLVLPLGGPKGSGLSLMMEVMAGVLSGSAFGGEVGDQYRDRDRPQDVGHCLIALDPSLVIAPEDYRARYAALVARARACPPVDPDRPILLPGEPEALVEARRRREGIPVAAADRAALRAEAARLGVALPEALAA